MVGVARATINEWTKIGQIPAHRVLQVEAETGIRREVLRPDLYKDDDVASEGGRMTDTTDDDEPPYTGPGAR